MVLSRGSRGARKYRNHETQFKPVWHGFSHFHRAVADFDTETQQQAHGPGPWAPLPQVQDGRQPLPPADVVMAAASMVMVKSEPTRHVRGPFWAISLTKVNNSLISEPSMAKRKGTKMDETQTLWILGEGVVMFNP